MRHFLVDTDTAAADPVALVMSLRHPGVQVEAITIVAGNVPVDQGVQNALYALELLGITSLCSAVRRPRCSHRLRPLSSSTVRMVWGT